MNIENMTAKQLRALAEQKEAEEKIQKHLKEQQELLLQAIVREDIFNTSLSLDLDLDELIYNLPITKKDLTSFIKRISKLRPNFKEGTVLYLYDIYTDVEEWRTKPHKNGEYDSIVIDCTKRKKFLKQIKQSKFTKESLGWD